MRLIWGLSRLVLALLVAVPIGVFAFRWADQPPAPVWERSWGEPVPEKFRYLMYPVHPDEQILRDDAKGLSTVLQRGVLNTEEEVRAGGRVHVNGPRGEDLSVSLSDLSFLPPAGSAIDYVRRWQDDLFQRSGMIQAGRVDMKQGRGRATVDLRIREGMDDVRFQYETDGATAVAVAMWRESVASGRELVAFVGAMLTGGIAFGVVLGVTARVYRWRPIRRPGVGP
jgi:hypothetical protein